MKALTLSALVLLAYAGLMTHAQEDEPGYQQASVKKHRTSGRLLVEECGVQVGGKSCPTNQCCSFSGYCGYEDRLSEIARTEASVRATVGVEVGGKACRNLQCCSFAGLCGNGDQYCGRGCQNGPCYYRVLPLPQRPRTGALTIAECGAQVGGKACPKTQCCSFAGYCGNGDEFCGRGCQNGPCYSLLRLAASALPV
ncbi:unnamed protein product [Urochloa decumbens]|uniref:Chitin-binding type-1 domain-containing protein n=1 Tax=Urochloa decumbens TaxID=240449 RepID=A0ABC9BT48_9POAL